MGLPILQVEADKVAPDLTLIPVAELNGVVVDQAGHTVAAAEVYSLTADGAGSGPRAEPLRTGSDGSFHLDRLDPDDAVALRARSGDATTNGAIVARPRQGKVTLTVGPAQRPAPWPGDRQRRPRIAAKVSLWWMARSARKGR